MTKERKVSGFRCQGKKAWGREQRAGGREKRAYGCKEILWVVEMRRM
jgi:hypothetical protein